MNKPLTLAVLAALSFVAAAQTTAPAASAPAPLSAASAAALAKEKAKLATICDTCGLVQEVKQITKKGKGGALGMIGGAVAGGMLGSTIGKGDGKTVATVGGAVGGAVIGNEIQKKMTSKKVWVTTVKMKDGTVRTFEQEPQPAWVAGNTVKADGAVLTRQP